MLLKQTLTTLLGLASVHALTTRAIDRRADGYENLEGLENAEGGLCRFEMVTKHVAPGDVLGRSSAPYYRNSDDTQAVTPETIECLRSRGITHVISLNSQAHAEDIRQGLESAGIAYTAIPVEDFHDPTQADFAQGWEAFRQHRGGTLVWCGYGHGRTGTMITALQMYIQHETSQLTHWSDAQYGENFVETPEQKQALNELEKSLKAKGPQGATPAPPNTDNRPQGVTPNPAEAMDVDADKSDEATQIERPQTGTSNPAEAMDVDTGSSNEPMDVDRPQGVTPNPPTAMDVDRPQGVTPNPPTAMDVDTANSQEPMDIDEEILTRWRQGQFGTVNCVAAIAALTALSNNKLGRSLSKPSLGARAQEDDCSRAREMALKAKAPAAPSTASCSKVSTLDFGFQLKDNNWAGTYDSISVAFASEEDKKSKNGQHQQVEIARAPSAGLHVWKPIDLKKFFGASSVALRDIRYVGIYDYSAGLGINGDRWEFQGLKLRGQCLGSTKMVEVDKFASENKYLQHSNKNKGNPWIFQMPFFPKIDDGHRGTAELVWGGNMTVSDWKPTGVQGEKEPAASEQVCFSEGGSSKCNEGGDKNKYE